ncbi:MAG: glycoside hydrolase family 3 protein [Clostridiales bacterium]|nr:glycoside hydrolase family 3 protein [Clostridiales bacterium]
MGRPKAKKIVLLICMLGALLAVFFAMRGPAKTPQDSGKRPEDETGFVAKTPPQSETEQKPEPETEHKAPAVDLTEEYISACINKMSLEEKIGQMFICAFRDDTQGVKSINANMREVISNYHIGGVILFGENLHDKAQTSKLIADLQSKSDIPLFIATDEEGGTVSRLSALGYEKLPGASRIGSSGDSQQAFGQGSKIGINLRELGFNLNFAPVADINSNKQNAVIGSRAFSGDAKIAGEMVGEFVKGLQGEGIIATLKHFPGHGDTKADSHYGPAFADHDTTRLNGYELVPFKMGIEAGAGLVMVGHISLPNVTGSDEAAIFSEEIVTRILRNQMGFTGAVITDALDMGAVVKYCEADEAAVKAVMAGVDILLMPQDIGRAFNGLLNAVESGGISESRIDESLIRIFKVKMQFSIMKITDKK